jgi:hypothetical protein
MLKRIWRQLELSKSKCLAVTILIFLSLGIIGVNPAKQTLAPMDLLLDFRGFDGISIDPPLVNPERSDSLDFVLTNWRFFRNEIREGRFPSWNPNNQLGNRGIQLPIFQGLTLPFFAFLATPNEAVGYTLAIITNFLVAGLGSYLLLLFLFGNRLAALFGAITFAFCGFNVAWAHWPHLTTSAWIPWVLAAILRFWQTDRLVWAMLFSASTAMLVLGGFPFVTLLGAIATLLLIICLLFADFVSEDAHWFPIRKLVNLTIAGLAGGVLVAPSLIQLHDFLANTDLSWRSGKTILDPSDLLHLFGIDWGDRI